MRHNFDVIIVGGGIIGAATSYFLAANPSFEGTVAVVERDPSYAKAATTLSASSIRQQFSTPVNIEISRFGISFLRDVAAHLAVGGDCPDIALTERGYLFLATARGAATLRENIAVQRAHGIDVADLSPGQLAARFPWLNVEDLAAASIAENGEGWFDAYSLLQAFRAKARALGVTFIKDEVADVIRHDDGDVGGVITAGGQRLASRWVVNAAGTRGHRLAGMAGVALPVRPRKRCVFVFDCRTPLPDCPLVIDPSGLYFRPEGQFFICGLPPDPDVEVDVNDFDVDYSLFEDRIWPLLAGRVQAFEAIKLVNAWAGHYDYNSFDRNAVIGPAPAAPHFLIANGFSGHGLQQAPAVGRGLAELIIHGRYTSLDLSPLSIDRILENRPLLEKNVI